MGICSLCGNGTCDTGTEDCGDCPMDCGDCPEAVVEPVPDAGPEAVVEMGPEIRIDLGADGPADAGSADRSVALDAPGDVIAPGSDASGQGAESETFYGCPCAMGGSPLAPMSWSWLLLAAFVLARRRRRS
jgi:MYXO-CTERM domain-containing protein